MGDQSRRTFVGSLLGGLTGIGAVASLYAMKKAGDPLPSVKAERVSLAPWVLGYLLLLTLFAYQWKRQIWREVE